MIHDWLEIVSAAASDWPTRHAVHEPQIEPGLGRDNDVDGSKENRDPNPNRDLKLQLLQPQRWFAQF